MFGNSCLGTTQYGGTGRSKLSVSRIGTYLWNIINYVSKTGTYLWDIWQKIYRQTIFIWNVIHAWTFQDKKTAEWGYKDKNSASWTYKNKS